MSWMPYILTLPEFEKCDIAKITLRHFKSDVF